MLQLLREHKIYAKLSKHDFFQSQIHHLGHIVSKKGIMDDYKNIKAIMEWPTHKNVEEVNSLIGLAGYYRRFIRIFSNITHPFMTF